MKHLLLAIAILFFAGCAHKTPQPEADSAHGGHAVHSPAQDHGHGAMPHATGTIDRSHPRYQDTRQGLPGKVFTLSYYYAKSADDIAAFRTVELRKDSEATRSMIAAEKLFLPPRQSLIIVEAVTPHEDDEIIQFHFAGEKGSRFTFKSYIYEFSPFSL